MQNKSELSIRERKQSVNNHKVDRKKMQENFDKSKNMIAAEPLYILLGNKGISNAIS